MPTSDADHRELAPHGVADMAVNRLYRVGLDLHRALALVGRHPQAGQRIRVAMSTVDETIDELRRVILSGHGRR